MPERSMGADGDIEASFAKQVAKTKGHCFGVQAQACTASEPHDKHAPPSASHRKPGFLLTPFLYIYRIASRPLHLQYLEGKECSDVTSFLWPEYNTPPIASSGSYERAYSGNCWAPENSCSFPHSNASTRNKTATVDRLHNRIDARKQQSRKDRLTVNDRNDPKREGCCAIGPQRIYRASVLCPSGRIHVMRAFIVAAVVGLGSLPRVLAWGAAGHEIVATIAQSHLDPQALNTVCSILSTDSSVDQVRGADAPCYLATVATWADKIRFHARWSAPLHFINGAGDHPPDDCRFPGPDGWQGKDRANVLDAVQNVSSILVDFAQGSSPSRAAAPELAQEALKFLIHFVGDMHQPLHLSGRDRGGNSDKVHWDNRVTNLHSVWDNALIAKAIRLTPSNYSNPITGLPTLESSLRGAIYDPYIRRIVWEGFGSDQFSGRWGSEADSWLECPPPPKSAVGVQWALQEVFAPRKPRPGTASGPPLTSDSDILCPYAWSAPIHKLNCDIVWPPELDNPETLGRAPRKEYLELDTPKYAGRIEKEYVVEKLLAQGGVRLAGILNHIFAPQE